MTTSGTIEQGRQAFARGAWSEARVALADAQEPKDLELLATALHLTGHDDDADQVMERAHSAYVQAGDNPPAARAAFWLGMGLANRGDMARAGGWFARAHRILGDLDCVERGYLHIPMGLQQIGSAPDAAYEEFSQAAAAAERFDDADLAALGLLGQGQSLLRLGRGQESLSLLDEVMVSVEANEVSPIPTGIIYCAVISLCQEISDLRRAQIYTGSLSSWCARHPDLVPFRGQCLIHRSQILQLHGAWSDALHEAAQACERFPPGHPAVGEAHYQRGELHRLRGEFDEAEDAYRAANAWGHTPQPGLAQLRLAQGQVDSARASVERVLDEAGDPVARSRVLPAFIEIAMAADDLVAARAGADELTQLAEELKTELLTAAASHLAGAVSLVEGDARTASALLQSAAAAWRKIDAPYEAARARVLIGLACRELGDQDSATMELEAARDTLAQLGAQPELDRLDDLLADATRTSDSPGGLTSRELEVLRLLAAGKSNRAIADNLVISTHTVARHVQNIFTKLGVASRTAAAAYAFEHDLA